MESFKRAKHVNRRDTIPNYPPIHRDVRLTRCESCCQIFTNKDDLKHHVALTHTGRKPHACAVCGKRYGQLQHLKSHFKLHREARLQEFAILKHNNEAILGPRTPQITTVGSFQVPKALKTYISEPTFGSFGTLQSFTISKVDNPVSDNGRKRKKENLKLPKAEENNYVTNTRASFYNDEELKLRNSTVAISASDTRDVLSDIKTEKETRITGRVHDYLKANSNVIEDSSREQERSWRDNKSDRQTRKSKTGSDGFRTSTPFSKSNASVFSEPILLRTSAIRTRKVWDNPDYLPRGFSGTERVHGYDPVDYKRRTKHSRQNMNIVRPEVQSLLAYYYE